MDDDVHVCECIMYVFMHACMYLCTYERMCARMFGYKPNFQRSLTSSAESPFLPLIGAVSISGIPSSPSSSSASFFFAISGVPVASTREAATTCGTIETTSVRLVTSYD